MTQKEFYKTPAWRKARQAYIDNRIALDGGLCEVCRNALGKVVHHYRVWLNDHNCNDPAISLNPDNFRYECQKCHNCESDPRKPGRTGKRYTFDSRGDLIPTDPPGLPPI